MSEVKKWYRIGFNNTPEGLKPRADVMIEVGTNERNKVKTFFLAPPIKDSEDMADIAAIHSIQAEARGFPNGYFPSLDEAKFGVKGTLEDQKKTIQQAIDSLDELSETVLQLTE